MSSASSSLQYAYLQLLVVAALAQAARTAHEIAPREPLLPQAIERIRIQACNRQSYFLLLEAQTNKQADVPLPRTSMLMCGNRL